MGPGKPAGLPGCVVYASLAPPTGSLLLCLPASAPTRLCAFDSLAPVVRGAGGFRSSLLRLFYPNSEAGPGTGLATLLMLGF